MKNPKKSKKTATSRNKTNKLRWHLLSKENVFSRKNLIMFSLIFALIGGTILYLVFAGSLSNNDETDQYNRINQRRSAVGIAGLTRSACLANAAREWSQHMAAFGRLHHSTGSDGKGLVHSGDPGVGALVNKHCPDQWSKLGENVGTGMTSESIFAAFVESDAHRQNIEDGAFNLMGVGAYRDDRGAVWITQLFAQCNNCASVWYQAPSYPGEATTSAGISAVGTAARSDGRGYWAVNSEGKVAALNGAGHFGDLKTMGVAPNRPIVGMAATPSGGGYWLVASDGGIFSFGDAGFYGSTGNMTLNKPIVGIARTPSGGGYWLVASDGGIFSFGNAGFYGSTGSMTLNKPIIGMTPTPSGGGYWLYASDGGIFSFGDAGYHGSTGGMALNRPIVGMAATPSGGGYWLVASDGGIFSFGNAGFYGSAGDRALSVPIIGMVSMADGAGYVLALGDGSAIPYGSAQQVYGITVVYQNFPPSAPTNVRAPSTTKNSVSLEWNAATDNRGIKEYRVYKDGQLVATTSSLGATIKSLKNRKTYSFQVEAVDHEGAVSPKSAPLSVMTR